MDQTKSNTVNGQVWPQVTMTSATSPKSSLAKLVLYPKPKPFKVMVLGQSGVGKSGKD